MYTYLTMTVGQRPGMNYLLDPGGQTSIGRGAECTIMLADALCSRVHATVSFQGQVWRVRDHDSRNGTFVNEQRIGDCILDDGQIVRVGATEFAFHQSEQPPTVGGFPDAGYTQTVVRDTVVGAVDSAAQAIAAIQQPEQAQDLLLLYQLAIKLLSCADANALMAVALDLLRERTRASVVGFLWVNDERRLKPKLVIPDWAGPQTTLSEPLTRLVCDEGHAVWIANQQASGGSAPEHFADAMCVPLISRGQAVGAIHAYLEQGRFRQSHFDFAISVANITTAALVRARKEESLQADVARLKAGSPGYDELVGEAPAIGELKAKIARLAQAAGCVLIRGESGTGKEVVARAVHAASPRADRAMLSVNCAAIPANLMESQLFGHKSGAFTGAENDHVGLFEQADLGTLLLDEIGELPLSGQSKLLRILEGHPFVPVGGSREIKVDVRVIAATNRDLAAYVREKKFREDLFYRLSVFDLYLPPLRERGGDVQLLLSYFFERFKVWHGRPKLGMSEAARRRLLEYSWPGNVRQMRNVIDSAVVLAEGKEIQEADLGLREPETQPPDSLKIADWERKLIREALLRTRGNVPEASRLLGIGRATLYRKLDEYAIDRVTGLTPSP